MYIRRKVFSVYTDELGEERYFSTTDFVNEDTYLAEGMYSSAVLIDGKVLDGANSKAATKAEWEQMFKNDAHKGGKVIGNAQDVEARVKELKKAGFNKNEINKALTREYKDAQAVAKQAKSAKNVQGIAAKSKGIIARNPKTAIALGVAGAAGAGVYAAKRKKNA